MFGAQQQGSDGEEYDLAVSELVYVDQKVIDWRRDQFVRLGFAAPEAETMAPRREADVHEIARWLEQGATHLQVMLIVAPLEEL